MKVRSLFISVDGIYNSTEITINDSVLINARNSEDTEWEWVCEYFHPEHGIGYVYFNF